jgi:predicted transcriptional regulator
MTKNGGLENINNNNGGNTVSKENLFKVQNYIKAQTEKNNGAKFSATVVEIAEGSNVALATAHRAIKELTNRGVIDVIKPSSRRFPITYIYNESVKDAELHEISLESQIEDLKKIIENKDILIKQLYDKISKLEGLDK